MSLFTTILEKLGLRKDKPQVPAAPAAPVAAPKVEAAKPAAPTVPAPKATAAAPAAKTASAPARLVKEDGDNIQVPAKPAAPKAISEVDVVAHLEQLAAASPAPLNWKVSIVDLLKLLGLDSSFDVRKEMAVELGCPADLMNDSAKMNVWLHKTVLKKIAENGGNIPQDLLN